ncbi:MAG: hypothetical protein ACP5N1_06230 [Candidatus Woesearchaeota archaeon]
MDTSILFNILASIGGASGVVTFFKWMKNRKAKVKVISSNADYKVYQDDFIVLMNLQLTNEKDKAVYITDIVGILKDEPSSKGKKCYTMRPTSPRFTPTKIEANSTIELRFEINFSHIDLSKIKRVLIADFAGFIGDGVPLVIARESDLEDKRDSLPLEMKLILHINGKELVESIISVFPSEINDGLYGTLNSINIKQLERTYLSERNHNIKFSVVK